MKRNGLLAIVIAAAACDAAPPAPSGEARAAGAVAFERAYPRLSFERPLFLTDAPGDTRLFVVTQAGTIEAFDPAGDPVKTQPFLDIRPKVSRRGEEEGLLGLAFHPDYARNGLFYVYYSAVGAPRQIVAQYRAPDRRTADPASERILLEMPDPWRNHNGGMLAFGPDGHLYIATGDGGSGGDPQGNGQRLDTLLGKILRVTADGRVPPDNPFVGKTGARGEIWAYGLRNPWRFSFDRETGALWAGDVGQNRWEEVDVIDKGGNYGWRLFEGFEPFDKAAGRAPAGLIAPVTVYGREHGCSITGGYVYRGAAVPTLRGQYLYADFCSGKVWALPADGAGRRDGRLIANVPSPSSFGEDAAGELYVTSFDGGLYRLTQK
jgi:glucose/arabinose dehydrogenase